MSRTVSTTLPAVVGNETRTSGAPATISSPRRSTIIRVRTIGLAVSVALIGCVLLAAAAVAHMTGAHGMPSYSDADRQALTDMIASIVEVPRS
jgi:hypothetical protein